MSSARAAALAAALCLLATTAFALGVPKLEGFVNDYAALLSPAAKSRITNKLEKLRADTGAQVVVLTLDSLEGEQLEEYSFRVAEGWALGREAEDDGALLLIAKNDRKMRFEIGYGLEPTLTDVMTKRILDQIIRPSFRAGDFDGGVERAIDAVDGLIRGTSTLPPPSPRDLQSDFPPRLFGAFWLLFLVPFVLIVVGTNPFQWFLYLFLVPFVAVGGVSTIGPDGAPFVVGLWLVGAPITWYFIGRKRKRQRRRRGKRGSRGWSGGAWSSGGGGGGGWSGGGGGFSGGGGGFGGGGSSGSW